VALSGYVLLFCCREIVEPEASSHFMV